MEKPAPLSTVGQKIRYSQFLLPVCILIGSGLFRFFRLGSQSLWFDEAYTAFVSQQPARLLVNYLLADGVHPPLYYFIMAVWIKAFGSSEWVLRLPSALAGVASVGILYRFSRKYLGASCGAISAVLLSLSPFAIWYSQDARMYSLFGLSALIAILCFWRFIASPSLMHSIWLWISHTVLYSFHYFGGCLLLVEICFLLLYWKKYFSLFPSFILLQFIALLPLISWWLLLLSRVGGSFGIGWIPRPNIIDIPLTTINFFIANGGRWSAETILAAGIILVFAFFSLKSKAPKEIICFLFLWTILPLGFIWIISQKVPIYMDRFFIFCLPPAILLVSVGIISIRSRISTFCTAVLFIIMACAIIRIYIPAEAFQKEDWKRSAEYLHLSVQQEDLLIFRVYQEIIPYHYYGLLDLPWTALETNRIIALPEKEKSHQRIYIVYWEISSSVHAFGAKETHMEEESNAAIRQWISENLVITERITRYKGLIIIVGKLKYQ